MYPTQASMDNRGPRDHSAKIHKLGNRFGEIPSTDEAGDTFCRRRPVPGYSKFGQPSQSMSDSCCSLIGSSSRSLGPLGAAALVSFRRSILA